MGVDARLKREIVERGGRRARSQDGLRDAAARLFHLLWTHPDNVPLLGGDERVDESTESGDGGDGGDGGGGGGGGMHETMLVRLLRSGVRLLQRQGARGCGAMAFDADGKARVSAAGGLDALVGVLSCSNSDGGDGGDTNGRDETTLLALQALLNLSSTPVYQPVICKAGLSRLLHIAQCSQDSPDSASLAMGAHPPPRCCTCCGERLAWGRGMKGRHRRGRGFAPSTAFGGRCEG